MDTIPFLFVDQRALGFSMRVERAGADDVAERLAQLKRKVTTPVQPTLPAIQAYEEKIAASEAEKEIWKKKKKEETQQAKKQRLESEELDDSQGTMDPEIAQMLGFKGFGSSKK